MRSTDRFVVVAAAVMLAFGIDQGSKWLIENSIMLLPSIIEVAPFLNIVLVYNTGVSFGMFGGSMAERQIFLIVLNAAIAAGLLVWLDARLLPRSDSGLVWSAAVPSEISSIVGGRGGVTDFLDFHWGDLHWPAFNLADVAISIGFATVLYASNRKPDPPSKEGGLS